MTLHFLRNASVALGLNVLFSCQAPAGQPASSADPWLTADTIEQSVKVPAFPDTSFPIADFGARPEPGFDNRNAINQAIEACHRAGGGKVVVPSGTFETGGIRLLSQVNLHLEEGAELRFSTNPGDFLPLVQTSFEGTELMNIAPLIYAHQQKNVAITGKGILNGQADQNNWWPWKGHPDYGWKEGMPHQNLEDNRPRLVEMAEAGVPVKERIFGPGSYIRPTFVEFFECTGVLIKDVRITHAPFWVIHPIKSSYVLVDGVYVDSHGPNNDGCNPEYCRNVVIKNCTFNTGDDCIAIKSGRNEDGRRVGMKSERILIKNCKMIDGHGGVVMGSEISGGVSHVFVENCVMDSPNLDRAIRIKTNTKRGGVVEHIYVRNVEVGQVKEAVLKVNMRYATYNNQEGNFLPVVRHIKLEKIRVKDGGFYGILCQGLPGSPIQDITLKDVVIEKADEASSLEYVENLRLIDTYINGALVQSPAN